ncbi:hypothetical protein PILCRDRAFT_820350, partial [Piloderma croceum F 1598]
MMNRSSSSSTPPNNMVRTTSWQSDPDLYALQALTQALELGKKILRDRIDNIPDVRSQGTATDRDSWSLSYSHNSFSVDPFVPNSIDLGAN